MKNISVTLENYLDDFVHTQVSLGKYKNASEVIRAALRLLENEEEKIAELKEAIQEGYNSAKVEDFDFENNLKTLKSKTNLNG